MIRSIKWLAICISALAITAVLAVAVYDITQFLPYRESITSLIQNSAPEDRNPPAEVAGLLRTELNGHTSSYTARLLLFKLGVMPDHRGMMHWHSTYALWSLLVYVHLSENERTALLASLAPTGRGIIGLSAASQAMYGRALSVLSLPERASIVALIRGSYIWGKPERLEQSRDALLAKYATST